MIEEDKIILPEPEFLKDLNDQQKLAVQKTEGPVLVLSGAGTGKTKVLTTRIANLIYTHKANMSDIMAVTFTNKAAFEMKLRVSRILRRPVEGMFIGTFHSIGARILRKNAELLDLKSDFTILDSEDQIRLLKQVISFLNLDTKKYVPKNFAYFIDSLKNQALSWKQISNHEFELYSEGKLSKIYELYQNRLQDFNAVDFGDLILRTLELLRNNEKILFFYQEKLKYILVDEYQDTNVAQYLMIRILASKYRNICCVGDEDQSIYGWRGAQLNNILNFEKDFSQAKIIRLEQNYRSTGNILSAASNLISENNERIGKKLWTSDPDGKKVDIFNVEDDNFEAIKICQEIKKLILEKVPPEEIAILSRASFQFKLIEDRLLKENIKYKVIGGPKFYDRKEIKDALAYFRIMTNIKDDIALERIINIPRRGIGSASLSKLYLNARSKRISLFESLKEFLEKNLLTKAISKNIYHFISILEINKKKLEKESHAEVAGALLDDAGYSDMLKNDKTYESEGRLENLKKLVSDISTRNSIYDFLEEINLVFENISEDEFSGKISLMTLHSSKGLEFDNVFLPGWEEGIFPNQRSIDENGNSGLEEERRLAYVGMTRAKKKLNILFSNFRKQYNQTIYKTIPSRFLSELPKKSCELRVEKIETTDNSNLISSIRNPHYNIGDKIFHAQMGKGIVLGINDDKLQIRFEKKKEILKVLSDFVKKI